MSRKRKTKPYKPPTDWDLGPDAPAAKRMSIVEERGSIDPKTGRMRNPNDIKGRRKVCWVELYGAKGVLSERQVQAGLRLAAAFEQTHRTAPAIKKVQVDTFPKPDQNVAIMMDRVDKYHVVARYVPARSRAYIDHVVLKNRPIRSMPGCGGGVQQRRYLERLAEGLEQLADGLKI